MIWRIALAAFLTLCIATLGQQSRAQFNGCSAGFCGGAPGGGGFTPSCTASTNWLARATGVTLTADKQNYDNLLCGLVTDGVCCAATGGVLDVLYMWPAPDTATAKLNLTQNAFNLTQTGSLTFSAYHGYTGDASTGFFDTGFNAFTAGGNYAQNSATFGCYLLSNRAATQPWAMGGYLNNRETRLFGNQSAGPGGAIFTANDNSGANFFTTANAQGSWLSTRTSSSLTTLYKNEASVATSANVSGQADSLDFFLFADNANGVAAAISGDQQGSCFIAAGMNATQAVNTQHRINSFMTAYSINVY